MTERDKSEHTEAHLNNEALFPSVLIRQEIRNQGLPDNFYDLVDFWYSPLSSELASRHSNNPSAPLLVGINGAQGSGKSTTVSFLKLLLERQFGKRTVTLSLDDFYLTRTERVRLSRDIHPLFITRGVPGTHDIDLASGIVSALKSCSEAKPCLLPVFDKSTDDRKPADEWTRVTQPPDIILFEGWCYNAPLQGVVQLNESVNTLEKNEDPDGRWRSYIYEQLQHYHEVLFDQTDFFLFISIPDFSKVAEWRGLQEQKLAARNPQASAVMDEAALNRFIQHYERITRDCLQKLPAIADAVIRLDAHHNIASMRLGTLELTRESRWLISTDMDGTLLSHDDYSYEGIAPLIRRLSANQIPVVLNTSKTRAETQKWAQLLHTHSPYIVENGSAIYFPFEMMSELEGRKAGLVADREHQCWVRELGTPVNELQQFVDFMDPDAINFLTCTEAQAMALTGLTPEDVRAARNRAWSVPLHFSDSQAAGAFKKA
ncbi:MAG: HAD hydrolase family protein, partial [Pseudomonadales bacterium]|nr:HAD hydrolase family protein [Pseudomonadales bacterium]